MKAAAVRKYFQAFLAELKRLRAEGMDFVLHLSYIPLLIIILYFLWSIVYQNTSSVQGYSFNEMMAYVLVAVVFRRLIANSWVAHKIEHYITDGDIVTFLCRPFDFKKFMLSTRLAHNFYFGLMLLPVLLIILAIFNAEFKFLELALALAILVAGFAFTFLEFYTIGLCAFWLERIYGLRHAFDWMQEILSGTWFPVTLFPAFAQQALQFLPFQHLVYTPTALALGKISLLQGLEGLAVLIIWVIALNFASNWIWKKGFRKYDGKC